MKKDYFATIMKYVGRDGEVHFIVEDINDYPDIFDSNAYMDYLKSLMLENGEMKEHIYTKCLA